MLEKNYRSITKAITWRVTAFLDTAILAFLFTSNPLQALAIGGFEILTKSVFYYAHERLWLWLVRCVDSKKEVGAASWRESRACSLTKTLTWRIVGSVDTFIIALLVTGELGTSASIGGAEVITKSILYYLHERMWMRVRWGVQAIENVEENEEREHMLQAER